MSKEHNEAMMRFGFSSFDEITDRINIGAMVEHRLVAAAGGNVPGILKLEAWIIAQGYEKKVRELSVMYVKIKQEVPK